MLVSLLNEFILDKTIVFSVAESVPPSVILTTVPKFVPSSFWTVSPNETWAPVALEVDESWILLISTVAELLTVPTTWALLW